MVLNSDEVIDVFSNFWILFTSFFTEDVIYYPLFSALLLMPVFFYIVYLLISLLDFNNWIRGY